MRTILIATVAALLASPALASGFSICPDSGRRIACVYDGDTFWTPDHVKFRIKGLDAPEMHPRCASEGTLAVAARDRLLNLLNGARRVVLDADGHDRYRRTLATVYADGRDVADILISEGLAVEYGHGKPDRCAR